MCSTRRTPAVRAAAIALAASSVCTASKLAPRRGFRIPTRLTTASQPLNS